MPSHLYALEPTRLFNRVAYEMVFIFMINSRKFPSIYRVLHKKWKALNVIRMLGGFKSQQNLQIKDNPFLPAAQSFNVTAIRQTAYFITTLDNGAIHQNQKPKPTQFISLFTLCTDNGSVGTFCIYSVCILETMLLCAMTFAKS